MKENTRQYSLLRYACRELSRQKVKYRYLSIGVNWITLSWKISPWFEVSEFVKELDRRLLLTTPLLYPPLYTQSQESSILK